MRTPVRLLIILFLVTAAIRWGYALGYRIYRISAAHKQVTRTLQAVADGKLNDGVELFAGDSGLRMDAFKAEKEHFRRFLQALGYPHDDAGKQRVRWSIDRAAYRYHPYDGTVIISVTIGGVRHRVRAPAEGRLSSIEAEP